MDNMQKQKSMKRKKLFRLPETYWWKLILIVFFMVSCNTTQNKTQGECPIGTQRDTETGNCIRNDVLDFLKCVNNSNKEVYEMLVEKVDGNIGLEILNSSVGAHIELEKTLIKLNVPTKDSKLIIKMCGKFLIDGQNNQSSTTYTVVKTTTTPDGSKTEIKKKLETKITDEIVVTRLIKEVNENSSNPSEKKDIEEKTGEKTGDKKKE